MLNKRWIVMDYKDYGAIVVIPENDIEEHDEPGYLCRCRPTIIKDDKTKVDEIIHRSFDRRELKEVQA